MFRITYGYFKVDENFRPIGDVIIRYVDGESVGEVNRRFNEKRLSNDLVRFTTLNFISVEEIKEY